MRAVFAIDQLNVHPYLVTDPPHSAFEDVVHPKLAADLLCVDRFALVGERGISGDHETPGKTREVGRQVVGDAIDEKFLLGIVRQIGRAERRSTTVVELTARRLCRSLVCSWWELSSVLLGSEEHAAPGYCRGSGPRLSRSGYGRLMPLVPRPRLEATPRWQSHPSRRRAPAAHCSRCSARLCPRRCRAACRGSGRAPPARCRC